MAEVLKITNKGLDIITGRLKGIGAEPKYVHWGTGTTPASADDIALQAPGNEARVSGTSSQETTTVTNDTYQVIGNLTCSGSSKAITEVGLFDAATNGNLFFRGTINPINVSAGDGVQFTIKVQFEQA